MAEEVQGVGGVDGLTGHVAAAAATDTVSVPGGDEICDDSDSYCYGSRGSIYDRLEGES